MVPFECPNCGANEIENNCCPYCGTVFVEDAQADRSLMGDKKRKPSPKALRDPAEYYYTYRPDRSKAMVALRIDTGVSPMEARRKIDLIFDFYENQ